MCKKSESNEWNRREGRGMERVEWRRSEEAGEGIE